MVALLLTLASLIALGVAAVRGWLPDTRDPEFSLGRVLHGRDEAAPAKPAAAGAAAPTGSRGTGSSGPTEGRVATKPAHRRTRLAHA
jgi:hypothetical protein